MNDEYYNYLIDKSIESFLLSLEIFNKPTIKYKLEGCLYSLCNAWELLLKAKLIKKDVSIYYPDKKDRSLSITDCISKVFNNDRDPIVVNLKTIISFRNMSTHMFIPEYEYRLMPFLSFCVKSYTDKLYEFSGKNIEDNISTDFLSLFVSKNVPNESTLLTKYDSNVKELFDKKTTDLSTLLNCDEKDAVAYNVKVLFARVSNKNKADFTFYSTNNIAEGEKVKFIDKLVDYNQTHTLTHNQIANEIDEYIKKNKIPFTPIREPIITAKNPDPHRFTTACLDVLIKAFKFSDNNEYIVKVQNGNSYIKKYSKELETKIISLIHDDKDVVVKNKK